MDKSTKLYIKAMDLYCKGNIDKAMDMCEESISENISNKSSINLKGLLYYFKGDLENAQALWKMNYQVNKDDISKKYYESSNNDEEKLKMYIEATRLIKEMHINEALKLLYNCKESDFNSIQVNNSLAICLMKKGEYGKAAECVKKVLELDKKDSTALESKKLLKEYNVIQESNGRWIKVTLSCILGAIAIVLIFAFFKYFKLPVLSKVHNNTVRKSVSDKAAKITISPTPKPAVIASPSPSPTVSIEPSEAVQNFPVEDIKNSISEKDYDKIYGYVQTWKDKNLSVNDKTVLVNAVSVLKQDGVQFYYNEGSKAELNKEYSKAKDNLIKAYNYGQDSFLYPHIVYFLASSEQNLQDIEAAMKYYKEYDSKYPSGNYEEIVLYQLALMNKNIDIGTSKQFAKKLSDSYPYSIYNNSNIKEILSK